MSDEEPAPPKIVHLDQAKTGRSTCKATGEKIEKDEFRVGMEVYTGGHISMGWQVCSHFKLELGRCTFTQALHALLRIT